MNLFHSINLPGLQIPGNIFLAPMAGYTDKAYREVAVRHGASFTYTEMVSLEALYYGNVKTTQLMEAASNEEHRAIQVFGSKPETVAKAIPTVLRYKPSLIDLNAGCPVPKITKTRSGSALMQDISLLKEMLIALKEVSPVPISVKIRSGWDAHTINFLHAAEAAVEAGVNMLTLHPRTKTQGYSGTSKWLHLKELKAAVPVPVIGSGDLMTAQDIQQMLEETGIDGVMIARGAIGNPFIFSQSKELLQTGNFTESTPTLQVQEALQHLKLCITHKGEQLACKEMKKHICAYTKGLAGSAAFRNTVVHCESEEAYREAFSSYWNQLKNAENTLPNE